MFEARDSFHHVLYSLKYQIVITERSDRLTVRRRPFANVDDHVLLMWLKHLEVHAPDV